jgi:hypothetical protein
MLIEPLDDVQAMKISRQRRILRCILWVGCVWFIGWAGICIEQAVAWTDAWDGVRIGAVVGG